MAYTVKELNPIFAAEVTGFPVTSNVSPEAVEFLEIGRAHV